LFQSGDSLSPEEEPETEISYQHRLNDLDKVRAIEIKANRKSWLVRTGLT
jgi:hypothetical protein